MISHIMSSSQIKADEEWLVARLFIPVCFKCGRANSKVKRIQPSEIWPHPHLVGKKGVEKKKL